MRLDEKSAEVVVLNTHRGLYKCKRLWFGLAPAVAIWQRFIESILAGLKGVSVFIDDIKMGASSASALIETIDAVLSRLNEYNVHLRKEKCAFFEESIVYCGVILSEQGIRKMPEKMSAIENMPRPTNIRELQCFVGMINYYNRFIPNVSSVLHPFYAILRGKKTFIWNTECEAAFRKAKDVFQSDTCLAYFDSKLELRLATDASPTGCGAMLSHALADGTERPIMFISATFNATQRKWAQVDKEAYAIVWAVKRLYQYVYGRKFELVTDNRAIQQIFSPEKSLPIFSAMRMQHYAIFLKAFMCTIRFKKSELNANADCLPRSPVPGCEENIDAIDSYYIDLVRTIPVTFKEIKEAINVKQDVELCKVIKLIEEGKALCAKTAWNSNPLEFTLEAGILLRGHQVVIPSALRKRILDQLHVGHFGIIKMKNLARGFCW